MTPARRLKILRSVDLINLASTVIGSAVQGFSQASLEEQEDVAAQEGEHAEASEIAAHTLGELAATFTALNGYLAQGMATISPNMDEGLAAQANVGGEPVEAPGQFERDVELASVMGKLIGIMFGERALATIFIRNEGAADVMVISEDDLALVSAGLTDLLEEEPTTRTQTVN